MQSLIRLRDLNRKTNNNTKSFIPKKNKTHPVSFC